jgi:hypothetical protein
LIINSLYNYYFQILHIIFTEQILKMLTVVRFPAEARGFSLLHNVQTGPGAHPASYPMDTGGRALSRE